MDNNTARRFEHKDEKSSKFWEISVAGNGFTVRYGKIGTAGQTQSKEFADAVTAEKQAQKLIAEKVGKGYLEVGAQEIESPSNQASQPAAKAKAEKPAKVAKPSNAKAETPANIAKNSESTAEVLASLAGSSEAIDRLLAKHPKAGADLLEKLSHSSDKATRKAVCLNPNTSKETLVRLAPQFPGDFFQNPAFDWLLLEDPNLLFNIGGGVLKNILKRPECPVSFLKWAANHGDEGQQLAAAMNPLTPVESLRELLKSARPTVVAAARGHAALAGEETPVESDPEAAFLMGVKEAFAVLTAEDAGGLLESGYLGKHHVPALAREVQLEVLGYYEILGEALNYDHPAEVHASILSKIAAYEGASYYKTKKYRNFALAHQACPSDVLYALSSSPDCQVRMAIAENPICPVTLLELLARDEDEFVRVCVAQNAAFAAEKKEVLLAGLSKSKEWRIRAAVAKNPACLESTLSFLAKDKAADVRENVAKNPACLESTLSFLAKDKDADVRQNVASNSSSPMTLCESLRNDKNAFVRRAAGARLKNTDDLKDAARDKNPEVRRIAASNPDCPLDVLTNLSHDKNNKVRSAVGGNPSCPMDIIERLSDDKDHYFVKEAVAGNPNCPSSILEKFAKDLSGERWIRREVASLPSCPPSVLRLLAQHNNFTHIIAKNLNCPMDLLLDLSNSICSLTRLSVAVNENCPKELRIQLMDELQKDKNQNIRLELAKIESCPESILVALSDDNDRKVRHAALSRNASALRTMTVSHENLTGWVEKETSLMTPTSPYREGMAENDPFSPTKVLASKGASHQNSLVRALAIAQPDVPIETLAKNQKHVSWLVRASLARNRNCPDVVLKSLEKDSHQVVAGLARRSLSVTSEFRSGIEDKVNKLRAVLPDTRLLLDAITESLMTLNAPAPSGWEDPLKDRYSNLWSFIHRTSGLNPALQRWLPSKTRKWLLSPVYLQRASLAANPNCPLSLLEELASDAVSLVRCGVASNPNCSESLLATLAKDKNEDVRTNVASNSHCPATILESLARDIRDQVRRAVASNPNCPVSSLEALAKDKEPGVRLGVASNVNCSIKLSQSLLKALARIMGEGVAREPNCPLELLEKFAKNRNPNVRTQVALNPSCPATLLEILSKDEEVWSVVASNPNCPMPVRDSCFDRSAEDCDPWVRRGVASNIFCTESLLVKLSEDKDTRVRSAVASNPLCPSMVLEVLAKDEQYEVRCHVATNPNCPVELLQAMIKDPDNDVRCKAISNPNCPVSILHDTFKESRLSIQTMNMAPSPLILEDCIHQDRLYFNSPKLKLLAVLQPVFPSWMGHSCNGLEMKEQIFKSANSADPLERLAAALNPNLPTAQVMRLLDDLDVNVQRAAARHPNCVTNPLH